VENFATFEQQLIIERDQSDPNRVNMFIPPDCINNFLVGAMKIAFTR
jgi:phage tail sheath gpL-like